MTLGVRTLPALLTLSSKIHEPTAASGSPLYLSKGSFILRVLCSLLEASQCRTGGAAEITE